MKLLAPQPLPYDYDDWLNQPFHIRAKWVCQAWAVQGYGAPPAVYTFYILKIVGYIWGWLWFCSFSDTLGPASSLGHWWSQPEAIAKALIWSMLFEGLGLASGSGPLTGRYNPPFGGFLYFLRPNTVKIPFIPGMPYFGGDRRRPVDCLLYAAFLVQMVRVLIAPTVTFDLLLPVIIMLPLMGLTDRALYLATRPEHYFIAIICFLFPDDTIAGLKWVWLGVWFGAASSKLNRHFASVVSVMVSNSAVLRSPALRKKLFRDYPSDLRASDFAKTAAHFGTATEYLFPTLLFFGTWFLGGNLLGLGAPATVIGLFIMLGFHTFITAHIPMGVPIEWNFMMVYGGFALFFDHAAVNPFTVQSPLLIVLLLIALLVLPVAGNLFPAWVSFLMGMRFYAGNWVYSVWLFRDNAEQKIAENVTTTAPLLPKQLSLLYDEKMSDAIISRVIAFRLMHLHGRVLQKVLPLAVDDIDRYTWRDGELVCGVVIGWNFGDGHLHNEHLLNALQKRCNWDSGDVRCIFVDPQPFGKPRLDWRIVDAKDGLLDSGRVTVDELVELQPFPTEAIF